MAIKATQQKKKTPTELLRERKIAAYQDQIAHDEEKLIALDTEKTQMSEISIVGLTVYHKLFGAGTVTEQNMTIITVAFDFGNKRFLLPAAFTDGFLETNDKDMNERIAQYRETETQIAHIKNGISEANHAIKNLEKK